MKHSQSKDLNKAIEPIKCELNEEKYEPFYMIGSKEKVENGTLYHGGSTCEGVVFKDSKAFKQSHDDICYIQEYGFDEPYILFESDTDDEERSTMIISGQAWTHNSICDMVKEKLEPSMQDKEFIEYLAERLFDTCDWQSPETLFNELDIDEEFDIFCMEF